MLRRELFCRKPQLVGGGGDRSGGGGGGGGVGEGEPPLLAREGVPPPPGPHPFPQRAFIRRMERCGNAVAFLRRPSPGTTPPARRLLSCRRYFPYPSGLSCRAPGRVTHSALVAGVAMARARRRSRTPARADGAPQQARTSPGRNGREGSRRRPRDTRRTRYSPAKGTAFAFPQKGEYGGAGGVEGQQPLSPSAPRRAGDPPPMPGSSRNSRRCAAVSCADRPPEA